MNDVGLKVYLTCGY